MYRATPDPISKPAHSPVECAISIYLKRTVLHVMIVTYGTIDLALNSALMISGDYKALMLVGFAINVTVLTVTLSHFIVIA